MTSSAPVTGRGLVARVPSVSVSSATCGKESRSTPTSRSRAGRPSSAINCPSRSTSAAASATSRAPAAFASGPGGVLGVPPHDVGEHDRRRFAVRHAAERPAELVAEGSDHAGADACELQEGQGDRNLAAAARREVVGFGGRTGEIGVEHRQRGDGHGVRQRRRSTRAQDLDRVGQRLHPRRRPQSRRRRPGQLGVEQDPAWSERRIGVRALAAAGVGDAGGGRELSAGQCGRHGEVRPWSFGHRWAAGDRSRPDALVALGDHEGDALGEVDHRAAADADEAVGVGVVGHRGGGQHDRRRGVLARPLEHAGRLDAEGVHHAGDEPGADHRAGRHDERTGDAFAAKRSASAVPTTPGP